jgi:hypothetical protein
MAVGCGVCCNRDELQGLNVRKIILLSVIFLAACNQQDNQGRYDYGYGVACNQYGSMSAVEIFSDGRITNRLTEYQFDPPAQRCVINQDGSITIFNNLKPVQLTVK